MSTLAELEAQLEGCRRTIDDAHTKYCLAYAAGDLPRTAHWKKQLAYARRQFSTVLRRQLQLQARG